MPEPKRTASSRTWNSSVRTLTLDLREAELIKARQETQALQQEMAALEAERTERGMVLTLGDVLFDSGEATLKPGAARNIVKIASFMAGLPRSSGRDRGPYRQHG